MQKTWENRPGALRVGGPGANKRYAPSLREEGGAKTAIEGAESSTLLEVAE